MKKSDNEKDSYSICFTIDFGNSFSQTKLDTLEKRIQSIESLNQKLEKEALEYRVREGFYNQALDEQANKFICWSTSLFALALAVMSIVSWFGIYKYLEKRVSDSESRITESIKNLNEKMIQSERVIYRTACNLNMTIANVNSGGQIPDLSKAIEFYIDAAHFAMKENELWSDDLRQIKAGKVMARRYLTFASSVNPNEIKFDEWAFELPDVLNFLLTVKDAEVVQLAAELKVKFKDALSSIPSNF